MPAYITPPPTIGATLDLKARADAVPWLSFVVSLKSLKIVLDDYAARIISHEEARALAEFIVRYVPPRGVPVRDETCAEELARVARVLNDAAAVARARGTD